MTEEHRRLLQAWIDRVMIRPSHECGVFVGGEGQPFGTRARPWDEPDLLIAGTVTPEGIRLDLDSYGARVPWEISGITRVDEAEHPWGPALRVTCLDGDRREEIWLV